MAKRAKHQEKWKLLRKMHWVHGKLEMITASKNYKQAIRTIKTCLIQEFTNIDKILPFHSRFSDLFFFVSHFVFYHGSKLKCSAKCCTFANPSLTADCWLLQDWPSSVAENVTAEASTVRRAHPHHCRLCRCNRVQTPVLWPGAPLVFLMLLQSPRLTCMPSNSPLLFSIEEKKENRRNTILDMLKALQSETYTRKGNSAI